MQRWMSLFTEMQCDIATKVELIEQTWTQEDAAFTQSEILFVHATDVRLYD